MTDVDIYDIESGYWFRQKTFVSAADSPHPPFGRAALCLALLAAPDGSSWNIIMVGGILTFNGATTQQEMFVCIADD